MIHIHLCNCINPKYYSIHVDIQLNTAPFYHINHPERQKERDNNFLHKSKNSLRWILKGKRPKNFQNSTIFTITIESGIFERENRPERQKERADNFLHHTKNSLRWILKGNRPKNF